MPRLSVIVPAFNAGEYLNKCVGSILCQTFTDWELILIDDGSTDETSLLCDDFALSDGRIITIHQKNSGVSASRNAGLDVARGDYIAFADADDWLEPEAYALMFKALDGNYADSAAAGYYKVYEDESKEAASAPIPEGVYSHSDIVNQLVLPLLCDRISSNLILGTVWRYLFSRSAIMSADIRFSGAYLEDELFLIEYFGSPHTLVSVDVPLYCYYQNPSSVTRRYLPDYMDTFLCTFSRKSGLVKKFGFDLPDWWRYNTCWAGLLIAVANEFAPGSPKSFSEKIRSIKTICETPDFRQAVVNYTPKNLSRNKAVVSALIRRKMYLLLGFLYVLKNKSRVSS